MEEAPISIRPAAEADIARILELYRQLAITPSQEDEKTTVEERHRHAFAEIATDPRHHLLVIESDGQVVGTLVLVFVPSLIRGASPWAVVEHFVVDEAYRGRGLGTMLMNYAIQRAKEASCYRISLSSDLRREDAHRFYHALGFEPSAYGFRLYF